MEDKVRQDKQQPAVQLTGDDIRKMLAEQAEQNARMLESIVREIRKPTVIEQKQLDAQEAEALARNSERKDNAAGQIQKLANSRAMQRVHSHKQKNGQTRGTWVQEPTGPGYIICVHCQAIIRPGLAPKDYNGTDIYNNELYNDLFQNLPNTELFQ